MCRSGTQRPFKLGRGRPCLLIHSELWRWENFLLCRQTKLSSRADPLILCPWRDPTVKGIVKEKKETLLCASQRRETRGENRSLFQCDSLTYQPVGAEQECALDISSPERWWRSTGHFLLAVLDGLGDGRRHHWGGGGKKTGHNRLSLQSLPLNRWHRDSLLYVMGERAI